MEQQPFTVKDCALAALVSNGNKAESLRELKDRIRIIELGSIYYHFWGARLNPRFIHPEYHNDFANWAHNSLHDRTLAERLSIIDPTEYPQLEMLRTELVELIEDRMDELESIGFQRVEVPFYFKLPKIVVFQTELKASTPLELMGFIEKMTTSSIFYHFIDARRRTPEAFDDFSVWLSTFEGEHTALVQTLRSIDPYFLTLAHLRESINEVMRSFFGQEEK